jgi:hypothetical protein
MFATVVGPDSKPDCEVIVGLTRHTVDTTGKLFLDVSLPAPGRLGVQPLLVTLSHLLRIRSSAGDKLRCLFPRNMNRHEASQNERHDNGLQSGRMQAKKSDNAPLSGADRRSGRLNRHRDAILRPRAADWLFSARIVRVGFYRDSEHSAGADRRGNRLTARDIDGLAELW